MNPESEYCTILKRTITSLFFDEKYIPQGITVNVDPQLFRRILTDRFYFTDARNRVNHAVNSKENKKPVNEIYDLYPNLFASYTKFNPVNIKKDLSRAVDNLSEALDYLQQKRK